MPGTLAHAAHRVLPVREAYSFLLQRIKNCERLERRYNLAADTMKTLHSTRIALIPSLVLIVISVTQSGAGERPFQKNGSFSPYGEMNDEMRDYFARAQRDPQLLYELANRPLEETFELLREFKNRVGDSVHAAPPTQAIAQEILYKHPDFENFVQRTLRKMISALLKAGKPPLTSDGSFDLDAALALPRPTLSPSEKLDYDISRQTWQAMRSLIQTHPSPELRIRLLGPCLDGPEYVMSRGDTTEYGQANDAAQLLRVNLKQLTGEEIPLGQWGADVKAAREWWAKNEAKYAWVPPKPRPPSEPKPIPPRIPLTQGANSKPAATAKDEQLQQRTKGHTSTATVTSLWITGIAILLAAAGVVWAARKRK